jgi:uncharacterized protein (TIGR04141 family)
MAFSRVAVFLLQHVNAPEDAVNSEKSALRVDAAESSGINGAVFFQHSSVNPPRWVIEIQPVLSDPITGVFSASASGVLVLKESDRWFALSFGYGRSLLNPAVIVRQFGLRVALNLIDPARLRSMDTKTFEDLVVSKSTQSSKSSDLPAFGIDISRDILRGVAGVPRDSALAGRLHGADAITLVTKVEAAELPNLCSRLLADYGQSDYKENFAWIDQLAIVEDPATKDSLNDLLLDALRARDTSTTYMAAPETIEWEDVDHFTISPTRRTKYEDLDLDAYLSTMDPADLAATTLKNLEQRGVWITYARSGNKDKLWSVYQCLISEQRVNGRLYVLIEGRWFQVDETLSDEVDTYFTSLPNTTTLRAAEPGETEPVYNARMAHDYPDEFLHLDAKILRPGGASSGIEFCDLLGNDGTLIHVKRKSRSSTLSHLFAQGSVSARTLLADPPFRDAVRAAISDKLAGSNPAPWLALVPDSSSSVDARNFRVAYVVLTKPLGGSTNWMPFFSKLNLMQHGKLLQTMSVGVSVARLDN